MVFLVKYLREFMKKFLTILLVSMMLPISSVLSFIDTDQSHPNIDAIYWMNAYQYMVGYDDDSFRPDSAINRAEFLKVILTMTNNDVNLQEDAVYEDVKKGEWFFTYVSNATDLGLISGYPDGLFRPNAKIRVSEASKIISLSFDLPVGSKLRGDRWYSPYVRFMNENDLLPEDVVDPRSVMTRAQAAEVLYRVAQYVGFEPSVVPDDSDGSGDDDSEQDQGGNTGGDIDCEAAEGDSCFYISVDGSGDGSLLNPAGKFGDIVSQVGPGDYVYFRGGVYGEDNMTVFTSAIDYTYASGNRTGCQIIDGQCRFDVKSFIPATSFDGYASNAPAFNASSGTIDKKIVVKPFPGEAVTLDASDYFANRTLWWPYMNAAVFLGKSNWSVENFDIVGATIYITGNDTVNVDVVGNKVHDLTIDGGENPGLITIDRGIGYGGPSNIRVLNNELYNFYDIDSPGQIPGVDYEHHGAITMLSRQHYEGFTGGGTGRVEISGNEIHNVPDIFYMKNPATGPLVIENNHFRDSYALGVMNASNVNFENNLVEDVDFGFWRVSGGLENNAQMIGIDGQNVSVTNNTFVNFNSLAGLSAYTNGFVSRNNVFFGMTGLYDEWSNWSTPAYLYVREDVADSYPGTSGSVLNTVTSDSNCFVSPHAEFNFTQRRFNYLATGGATAVQNLGPQQSADIYDLDLNSEFIVSSNLSDVFHNSSAGNYALKSGVCTGKGKQS